MARSAPLSTGTSVASGRARSRSFSVTSRRSARTRAAGSVTVARPPTCASRGPSGSVSRSKSAVATALRSPGSLNMVSRGTSAPLSRTVARLTTQAPEDAGVGFSTQRGNSDACPRYVIQSPSPRTREVARRPRRSIRALRESDRPGLRRLHLRAGAAWMTRIGVLRAHAARRRSRTTVQAAVEAAAER